MGRMVKVCLGDLGEVLEPSRVAAPLQTDGSSNGGAGKGKGKKRSHAESGSLSLTPTIPPLSPSTLPTALLSLKLLSMLLPHPALQPALHTLSTRVLLSIAINLPVSARRSAGGHLSAAWGQLESEVKEVLVDGLGNGPAAKEGTVGPEAGWIVQCLNEGGNEVCLILFASSTSFSFLYIDNPFVSYSSSITQKKGLSFRPTPPSSSCSPPISPLPFVPFIFQTRRQDRRNPPRVPFPRHPLFRPRPFRSAPHPRTGRCSSRHRRSGARGAHPGNRDAVHSVRHRSAVRIDVCPTFVRRRSCLPHPSYRSRTHPVGPDRAGSYCRSGPSCREEGEGGGEAQGAR